MHPRNRFRRFSARLLSSTPRFRFLPPLVALVLAAGGAHAEDFDPARGKRVLGAALASSAMEHNADKEFSTPRTPEELLFMFLINPRYNAYLWRHPETLPSLMDRMTEPGFLLAAYQAALRPESYLHFLKGWTDIEKMRSYFEIMDPAVFVGWAGAAVSPFSYLAMAQRLTAPEKLRNWTGFAFGGRLPEMIQPVANQDMYMAWFSLPVNPHTYAQLQGPVRMLNPVQPLVMWSAAMDSGLEAIRRFTMPIKFDP